MSRMAIVFERRMRAVLAALPSEARALRDALAAEQVDERTIHALDLALEELATNTIRHGYPNGDAALHEIGITLHVSPSEVHLCIEDDALPFDPLAHPVPMRFRDVESAPVGGRGIDMVRRVVHTMAYRRTARGNAIELTITRPANSQREPMR